MKNYSLGFVFTPSFEEVLLIHKNKPEWQKGKLNGLGGKLEANETAVACMVRETKEESDLFTVEKDWVYVGNLTSEIFFTEVFACIYSGDKNDAKSMEEQKIAWFSSKDLPTNVITNLTWLIPLAIDKLKNNEPKSLFAKF